MGVGHVAVALGASRATPRVNVGWLVFAAFLSDFLLGIFAVLGLEHASVPDSYATKTLSVVYLPLLAWTGSAGRMGGNFRISNLPGLCCRRTPHLARRGSGRALALPSRRLSSRSGIAVSGTRLSQTWSWTLERYATGAFARNANGCGWNRALLEASGSKGSSLARYGMAVFLAVVMAMTWTQLGITTPPTLRPLSISWIVVPVVFAAMAYGLDWKRTRLAAGTGLNGFSRTQLASKA